MSRDGARLVVSSRVTIPSLLAFRQVVDCHSHPSIFHSPPSRMSTQGSSKNSQNDMDVEIDPIWVSSRTARQIYALGDVEKVCANTSCIFIGQLNIFLYTLYVGHKPSSDTGRLFNIPLNPATNRQAGGCSAAGWRTLRTVRARSKRVF